MKSLIKKCVLVAILLTTVVGIAKNDDPSVKINTTSAKQVNLTLNNFDKAIDVYIKDSQGVILYKETVEKNVFSRKYDLKTLPSGNYYFEIDTYTKVKTIPVYVDATKVVLNNENESVYFKPVVRVNNDKVYISKLALNEAPLKIVMYDSNFNLIFSEELSGSINLERKLDISRLEKGEYKLLLTSEGKSVIKDIRK
ncbi:hypothetical protein [Lutibacter sp. B1]|uniref:hypothetical protein n=1 Tax=Lutibacter sp. B1 TaxID=2725996 RepID=UPI0014568DF0|nr:hypothetical protein [Lutibacter sp. B1]NLP58602.1 hypothetical protein [Lutibacter sp. B1]